MILSNHQRPRAPGISTPSCIITISDIYRNLLCSSLHRELPEGRPEDDHAGGAATGGEDDDDDVDDDMISVSGSDQGLGDGLCGRRGLLPGQQRHGQRGQRGERPS